MIITINNDTLPNEMHHIAVALQRIAAEGGYEVADTTTTVGGMSVKVNVDTTEATAALDKLAAHPQFAPSDTFTAPVEPEMVAVPVTVGTIDNEPLTIEVPEGAVISMVGGGGSGGITDDRLDSSGLPWDARIHAGSRERNTDGSWRVRRRPKGVEEAEWESTLARVTSELRDLMEIPVTPGAVADAAAEEREIGDVHHTAHTLTDDEIDEFVDIVQGVTGVIDQHGELVSAENVFVAPPVILPPVVLPPVTITPPVIATDAPAVTTFAQLMVWLTGHTPKDEAAKPPFVARVNEILAANQLTTLQQLGQRAELIPQVLAQFVEAFGE